MAKNKLSCTQISALLSFYADKTLNILLRKLVKEHLESCPNCMNEYLNMLSVLDNNNNKQEIETENLNTSQYKEFKENLSAYVDNELPITENLKIKKFAILNPLARKDLEKIYKFKNLLYDAFVKTQETAKFDYSKPVINLVTKDLKKETVINQFYTLKIIFLAMIASIIVGFMILLNF